jgi:hypothetical protein
MRAAVLGVVAVAAVFAGLIGASGAKTPARPEIAGVFGASGAKTPARPDTDPSAHTSQSATSVLPEAPPTDPTQLAIDLNQAQGVIDDPASSSSELSSAGFFEQLATLTLNRERTGNRLKTLAGLDQQAAATVRADLAAAAALSRLVTPQRSLPRWKIVQPPPAATLLGYFKAAQARFGVAWQDLAAIEFIETKFGRVVGLSTAGAEGPMQFLPATWARYGSGSVHDQRAAIFGAARFLVANGAPGDIAGALHHYNPSADYVSSVLDYAGRMRTDARAYSGYYTWQVLYALDKRLIVLPVGYPTVRPAPLP